MIIVNSAVAAMAPTDSARLNLATSSEDFLSIVDYPLRPVVSRSWGKPTQRPRNRWKCCYFPQSFPVYRMQRLVSILLCLLGLFFFCVVAFVLVQVVPPPGPRTHKDAEQDLGGPGGYDGDDLRREFDFRTARKLEDHAEYKRSVEDRFGSDAEGQEEESVNQDNEDDLIFGSDNESNDGYVEDDEDDNEYNPVFNMDYFDFSIKNDPDSQKVVQSQDKDAASLSVSSFKTPQIRKKWTNLPNIFLVNDFGLQIIKDGVVFSPAVEALLKEPQMSDIEIGRLQVDLRTSDITDLQEPTWERCGRPKNQWVQLGSAGRAACARYRYPDDCLLVGEVLSFYLSRLLGVGHVPPVALSDPAHSRWAPVAPQMDKAEWGDAPVVALTPWLSGLVRDHMPSVLLNALLKNTTLSVGDVADHMAENNRNTVQDQKQVEDMQSKEKNVIDIPLKKNVKTQDMRKSVAKHQDDNFEDKEMKALKPSLRSLKTPKDSGSALKHVSERDLVRLMQWSDLLVFDYLTGNYDRVAYMQDAAEKEKDPNIFKSNIHNLVRNEATNTLWFLDNESGLIDAYTLLYGSSDSSQSSRFQTFHTQMLESMCIFRKSTMEAVLGLALHPEPHNLLVDFVNKYEPLFHKLPDPLENTYFIKHFSQRINEVRKWMEKCISNVQIPLRSKR